MMLLGLGQLRVAAGTRVDHGQDGLKVREAHALALAAVGICTRLFLAAVVEDCVEVVWVLFVNLAK